MTADEALARVWELRHEDYTDEVMDQIEPLIPILVAAGYAEADDTRWRFTPEGLARGEELASGERLGEFADLELGVFSSRLVMDDAEPILLVFHDDDGDWQFLSSNEEHADDIVHIHLGHVFEWDPTVGVLEDLPRGWKAWRWSTGDEWVREPTPPDQPHVEG